MSARRRVGNRAGVTMLELIVALSLIGILSGVVGLAWSSVGEPAVVDSVAAVQGRIIRERRHAIETGKVRQFVLTEGQRVDTLLAHPDGRVAGGEHYGVDPLTGRVPDRQAEHVP
jgi:prepilin-type N-terminal cleavage/methylation domain-containing protein